MQFGFSLGPYDDLLSYLALDDSCIHLYSFSSPKQSKELFFLKASHVQSS
jgi:hypothetical protein